MTRMLPLPLRCVLTRFGPLTDWDAAIVIPAKDEQRRIADCLDAIAVSILQAGHMTTGVILVINNTTDATAQVAGDWARSKPDLPFVLLNCAFAPQDAGVGSARRLGLDLACRMLAEAGILMTTDADTCVDTTWVAQNLAELQDADLICGTVRGNPAEAGALPPEIAGHGSAESDYLAASIALAALLDPQAHNPDPTHHNAAGASLALSRTVYQSVGGLPVVQMGEDRALAALIEAHDYRLRYSDTVIVETSCRMTGRTDGGMAGALRSRVTDADPLADEWMEPADRFHLRYLLRGKLRRAWPNPADLRRTLTPLLGVTEAQRVNTANLPPHFGMFVAHVENTSPALVRQRLHLSDCRAQLPRIQDLLQYHRTHVFSSETARSFPQLAVG